MPLTVVAAGNSLAFSRAECNLVCACYIGRGNRSSTGCPLATEIFQVTRPRQVAFDAELQGSSTRGSQGK